MTVDRLRATRASEHIDPRITMIVTLYLRRDIPTGELLSLVSNDQVRVGHVALFENLADAQVASVKHGLTIDQYRIKLITLSDYDRENERLLQQLAESDRENVRLRQLLAEADRENMQLYKRIAELEKLDKKRPWGD